MNLNTILLASCLCLMGFQSQAQIMRSEYYADLTFWEIAITPFQGAYPISAEQAQNLVHLRLDYDSQNRVVQAAVRQGARLKAFEGLGHLFINAPLTKVEYDANREYHYFYDQYEESTEVMQGVFRKVYEKDRHGRNIRLWFETRDGGQAKDFFGYVRYEWSYQPDGSVIEERFNEMGEPGPLRGDFQLMRTRIVYGANGYPETLQNVDEQGNLVPTETGAATLKYFFDTQGRFLRWEVYDVNGNPAIGPSHTAGEQNVYEGFWLKEIRFFDQAGSPVKHWSGAEVWQLQRDRFGNKIRRSYKTADGELMNGYQGFAEIVSEWSDDGRHLMAQYYLDAAGKPVDGPEKGVAKTAYLRDEAGKLLKVQKFSYLDGKYQLK